MLIARAGVSLVDCRLLVLFKGRICHYMPTASYTAHTLHIPKWFTFEVQFIICTFFF